MAVPALEVPGWDPLKALDIRPPAGILTYETVGEPGSMIRVPYDARWSEQSDHILNRQWLLFRWRVEGKADYGVKFPKSPHCTLRTDSEGRQWWEPYQDAPPLEPASLFAKRELTEDELCDPGLFDPLVYEPILGRMITPEPLHEWLSPLSAERMSIG